jgi:hypothetical protein
MFSCSSSFAIGTISSERLLPILPTITDRGPTWDSISNVRMFGRFRMLGGLSRSRNSAACITVMNALQRKDMLADAFLAKDRPSGRAVLALP